MKRKTFLSTIASAIALGASKGAQDVGLEAPKPIVLRENEDKEWKQGSHSMIDFAQHLMAKYNPHEKIDLTEMTRQLNEIGVGMADIDNPTNQVRARCPHCNSLLMLGPIGMVDSCPVCHRMIKVVPQNLVFPAKMGPNKKVIPERSVIVKRFCPTNEKGNVVSPPEQKPSKSTEPS